MKNNAPEWATHVATYTYGKLVTQYAKEDGFMYTDGDGMLFNAGCWTFTPIEKTESVYTQEMKDNGDRVKVDMKFKTNGKICTARLIAKTSVVFLDSDGEVVNVWNENIEPIVSEREEAEAKQLRDCFSECIQGSVPTSMRAKEIRTNLKRLQKAGLLAEIILPLKRS